MYFIFSLKYNFSTIFQSHDKSFWRIEIIAIKLIQGILKRFISPIHDTQISIRFYFIHNNLEFIKEFRLLLIFIPRGNNKIFKINENLKSHVLYWRHFYISLKFKSLILVNGFRNIAWCKFKTLNSTLFKSNFKIQISFLKIFQKWKNSLLIKHLIINE